MAKELTLPQRIKSEREKRGWTQEYMANLLGIKVGTLSGYERNYRTPDLKMFKKIADVFGLSTDYLSDRDNNDNAVITPQVPVELDQFIRDHPILRYSRDPIEENDRDEIRLCLKVTMGILKEKKSSRKL